MLLAALAATAPAEDLHIKKNVSVNGYVVLTTETRQERPFPKLLAAKSTSLPP
jgi:hypothetical protein